MNIKEQIKWLQGEISSTKIRPTVSELEKILCEPNDASSIRINPDGSITAHREQPLLEIADTLTKLNAVYVAAREIVRDDKFESFAAEENQALQTAIAEVEKYD